MIEKLKQSEQERTWDNGYELCRDIVSLELAKYGSSLQEYFEKEHAKPLLMSVKRGADLYEMLFDKEGAVVHVEARDENDVLIGYPKAHFEADARHDSFEQIDWNIHKDYPHKFDLPESPRDLFNIFTAADAEIDIA